MDLIENGRSFQSESEAKKPLELLSLDGEITLRQYTIADAPEAFALIDRNRKHLSHFGDRTARKYPTLESFQKSIEHPKNSKKLRFGIWNKEGALVGSINLTPQVADQHLGEVGYYLGAEFQGHGYVTRAVETLTDYAFGEGGFHTVFGNVHKSNSASEEVLLAAGYADHDWSDGQNKYYAYADHIAIRRQPGTNIADGVNTQNYPWKRIITGELSDLARQTVEVIGNDAFTQVIEVFQRFKKGNITNWEESRGWFLAWILEQIPTYVDAAKTANLAETQMQDLLFTVVGASPYETHNNGSEFIILGRALGEIAEKNITLTKQDIRKIKTMIKLGGKDGIVPSYLNTFEHALRVGLSVQDSTKIISHFSIDDVWVHPGYAIVHFRDALKALKTTGINPESAKYIFGEIEQLPKQDRASAYMFLEHAVALECPSRRITPQELIDTYQEQYGTETITDFLKRFIADGRDGKLLGEQGPDVINPADLKDKYFLPKKGKLEHSVTPYQAQRSLSEGMQDLQELAKAQFHRFEDVAEGFWTFDPKTSTWYSFGGKTEIVAGAIRHEFLPYDISELTDQPYLFHIHNEAFGSFLTDSYSDFPPKEFRDQERGFLMATPSRADYATVADLMRKAKNKMQAPRSFIAHANGVTEFTYPSDLDRLNQMAVKSREIRDQVILDFDWESLYFEDEATGVRMLVDALNKILPEGFSDKLS